MINFGHETEELEFKKSTSEMHDAMKDIVAIINKHEKGVLYFGVAPNGDVKGLQVAESTLRDVSRVIFESIKPQIYPQIQKLTMDGSAIIEDRFFVAKSSGENSEGNVPGLYITTLPG